jgi:hypothetical protein
LNLCFIAFKQVQAMYFFLIPFSLFIEIYSSLSRRKFPIIPTTGIRRQLLDLLRRFHRQTTAKPGKSAKFAVQREKPGTLPVWEDWLPF